MPLSCIVINYKSRADKDKISYFCIPKATKFEHARHLNNLSSKRREFWLYAIKRDELTDSKIKFDIASIL